MAAHDPQREQLESLTASMSWKRLINRSIAVDQKRRHENAARWEFTGTAKKEAQRLYMALIVHTEYMLHMAQHICPFG